MPNKKRESDPIPRFTWLGFSQGKKDFETYEPTEAQREEIKDSLRKQGTTSVDSEAPRYIRELQQELMDEQGIEKPEEEGFFAPRAGKRAEELSDDPEVVALIKKYRDNPSKYMPLAGLKGAASGATFGLSDTLLAPGHGLVDPEIMEEDKGKSAGLNEKEQLAMRLAFPTLSTVSEAGGAILPTLATGGTGALAKLAKFAPTAALDSAAAKVVAPIAKNKAMVESAVKNSEPMFKLGVQPPKPMSMAEEVGRTALARGTEGAISAGASDASQQALEGQGYDAKRTAKQALTGGLLGAGIPSAVIAGQKIKKAADRSKLGAALAKNPEDPRFNMDWKIRNTKSDWNNLADETNEYVHALEEQAKENSRQREALRTQIMNHPSPELDKQFYVLGKEAGKLGDELKRAKDAYKDQIHETVTKSFPESLTEATNYPQPGPHKIVEFGDAVPSTGDRRIFYLQRQFRPKEQTAHRDYTSIHDLFQGKSNLYKETSGADSELMQKAGFGGWNVEGQYVNPRTARNALDETKWDNPEPSKPMFPMGSDNERKSSTRIVSETKDKKYPAIEGSFQTDIKSGDAPMFIVKAKIPQKIKSEVKLPDHPGVDLATDYNEEVLRRKTEHYAKQVEERTHKELQKMGIPESSYRISMEPEYFKHGGVQLDVFPTVPDWHEKYQLELSKAKTNPQRAQAMMDTLPDVHLDALHAKMNPSTGKDKSFEAIKNRSAIATGPGLKGVQTPTPAFAESESEDQPRVAGVTLTPEQVRELTRTLVGPEDTYKPWTPADAELLRKQLTPEPTWLEADPFKDAQIPESRLPQHPRVDPARPKWEPYKAPQASLPRIPWQTLPGLILEGDSEPRPKKKR